VRFVCNGGCPKNRILHTPDGEPGLNYLCEGYKVFFSYIDRPMRIMAVELAAGRPPANIITQAMALGHIALLDEGRQVVRNSFDAATCELAGRSESEEAYGRLAALMKQTGKVLVAPSVICKRLCLPLFDIVCLLTCFHKCAIILMIWKIALEVSC